MINCGTVSANFLMKLNLAQNLKMKTTKKVCLKFLKKCFLLKLHLVGRFDRFRSKEKKENGDISTEDVREHDSGEESLEPEAAEKV